MRGIRLRLPGLVAAGVAVAIAAGSVASSSRPAVTNCGPWVVDVTLPDGALEAVSADAGEVWAVGASGSGTLRGSSGLVLRRRSGRWSTTTIGTDTELADVDAERGAAWIVGRALDGVGTTEVALRWDGTRWQPLRVPGLPAGDRSFAGVDVRAGDVWLVGGYDNSAAADGDFGWIAARRHADRWRSSTGDGQAWPLLAAVSVHTGADAWAVGSGGGSASTTGEVILHWNGSRWSDRSRLSDVFWLEDVVALARADAWAVGSQRDAGREAERVLVEHWDGSRWRRVATPATRLAPASLSALAASGRRSVWAAGEANGAALLLHWDGSRWQRVAAPPVAAPIRGLAAAPDGTLWAVGGDPLAQRDGFVARAACR